MDFKLDIILSAISIIFGAAGSLAGAISFIYVSRLKAAKEADIKTKEIIFKKQRLEHHENDTLFSEYRLIVESSKDMQSFLREEMKNLKKDIEELHNDRRHCRKENDELRLKVIQLEDEIRALRRRLDNNGGLSIVSNQDAA
jgi:predicted RNase H-like nuclease (RuvC/YqgF family)